MEEYTAEQEMEVEALEAILMDDLKKVDGQGPSGCDVDGPCFAVRLEVTPEDDENDDDDGGHDEERRQRRRQGQTMEYVVLFSFAHTPHYPDELPLMRLRSEKGMSAKDTQELTSHLGNIASENLGMAMMYTLIEEAKQWMTARYCDGDEDLDVDESGLTRAEREEVAEKKRLRELGTPVTAESFLEWRTKFEAEKALQLAMEMSSVGNDTDKNKRLTGRQYFEGKRVEGDEGDEEDDYDDDIDEEDLDNLDEEALDEYLDDEEDEYGDDAEEQEEEEDNDDDD